MSQSVKTAENLSFLVPDGLDLDVIQSNRLNLSSFIIENRTISFSSDESAGLNSLREMVRPERDVWRQLRKGNPIAFGNPDLFKDIDTRVLNRAFTLLISVAGSLTAHAMWKCIQDDNNSLCIGLLDLSTLPGTCSMLPIREAISPTLRSPK